MSDLALDAITVAVLGYVGWRVAHHARVAVGRRRSQVLGIVRGIRPRHVLLAIPTLLAVLVAALALVQLPVLSWGWWSAIGGQGNPVTGSTERTTGTALEWLVPLLFLAALTPALPLLAQREEEWFRWGAEQRSFLGRRWKDLQFGLVHALVGIPLGVAVALSIGGTVFTAHYLRGHRRGGPVAGLLESTRAHAAYNLVIVLGIALPAFVALALGVG